MIGVAIACIALLPGCPGDDAGGDSNAQTTGDATASGSGSSGDMMCTDLDSQVVWANASMLEPPMELGFADMLGFDVARSLFEEMGTVTMEFTTNCPGPVYLFGLVWDLTGGNETENADSLYISIDGGEEQVWLYGCSTAEGTDQTWWWLPIEAWSMSNCDHLPLELDLDAGDHTIVLRNREPGAAVDVAAIAGVALSHDPAVDLDQFHALPAG